MFETFKERRLTGSEKEAYFWFKDHKKESDYLQKAGKKHFSLIYEKDLSKLILKGPGTNESNKWRHDAYGEIAEVNDFWIKMDAIYELIFKSLLNHTLQKNRDLILGHLLFLKSVMKKELKHAAKKRKEHDRFMRKVARKFGGIVYDPTNQPGYIADTFAKINGEFGQTLGALLGGIAQIESKLSRIKV